MATAAQAVESMESFSSLFEESLTRQEMRIGEVITAEVVSVDGNVVVVNAGLKSESVIPAEEFFNDQGEVDVKVGDFVKVAIEALEDGYGATRLSRDKARRLASWLDLEEAMEQGKLVSGLVSGKARLGRQECRFSPAYAGGHGCEAAELHCAAAAEPRSGMAETKSRHVC